MMNTNTSTMGWRSATGEAIQGWLTRRIAESIGSKPEDIDVTVSFAYYGLDSVAALGISGDLSNWLGRKLSPTLTWDYPNIESLAAHLADEARDE